MAPQNLTKTQPHTSQLSQIPFLQQQQQQQITQQQQYQQQHSHLLAAKSNQENISQGFIHVKQYNSSQQPVYVYQNTCYQSSNSQGSPKALNSQQTGAPLPIMVKETIRQVLNPSNGNNNPVAHSIIAQQQLKGPSV